MEKESVLLVFRILYILYAFSFSCNDNNTKMASIPLKLKGEENNGVAVARRKSLQSKIIYFGSITDQKENA